MALSCIKSAILDEFENMWFTIMKNITPCLQINTQIAIMYIY